MVEEQEESSDFLLALVSSAASGSSNQIKNQDKALTILEGCGAQPEVLDACDPSNKIVLAELYELSGRRDYPQFFLVQGDQTSFFADYTELITMNDEGTLEEWLNMEIVNNGNSYNNVSNEHKYGIITEQRDLSATKFAAVAMVSSSIDGDDGVVRTGNEENEAILLTQSSTTQEEWNDPLLRYEGEISALESFLKEQDRVVDERRSFHNKKGIDRDKQQMQQKGNISEEFIHEIPKLQSMKSLISSDDDEAGTATTTNSSVFTLKEDFGLRIQPETTISFWLNEENNPKCTITLSNVSSSNTSLAFMINPSDNLRYMVHPIAGIIKPQTTVPITVFLLDEAKEELLGTFRKLGKAADSQQNDKLSIEYCHASTSLCNRLTNDYEKDFDALLSFWDRSSRKSDWKTGKSHLQIEMNHADANGYENIISSRRFQQSLLASPMSPSTATTATASITPTSSSSSPSRSQEKQNCCPSKNHCNSLSSVNTSYENDNIPVNVSTGTTVATQFEAKNLMEAEVERLRSKCEKLTIERYIVEGQLKEVREKVERSSCNNMHDDDVVYKSQIERNVRCGHCMKVFTSDVHSMHTPIVSQACGHSICRNCCHQILSLSRQVRRRRRNENMNSSEHLRDTISRDLFMGCVGDMNQVYSSSSDYYENDSFFASCPICGAPKAFQHGKLHENESVCLVLKLLKS